MVHAPYLCLYIFLTMVYGRPVADLTIKNLLSMSGMPVSKGPDIP
jgi:hypothetical protein